MKDRRLATAAVMSAVLVFAAVPAGSTADEKPRAGAAACANSGTRAGRMSNAAFEASTLCVVNVNRRSRRLPALRFNRALSRAARYHAAAMARDNFFGHTSPRGETVARRVRRFGYVRPGKAWRVGENLASTSPAGYTPVQLVRRWFASSAQRGRLLNRSFRDGAIGLVSGHPDPSPRPGFTYVGLFGFRR